MLTQSGRRVIPNVSLSTFVDFRRDRIGGGVEEDLRRTGGGLEEDRRSTGGGFEEDSRRIRGGFEEDSRRNQRGFDEDSRRIVVRVRGVFFDGRRVL